MFLLNFTELNLVISLILEQFFFYLGRFYLDSEHPERGYRRDPLTLLVSQFVSFCKSRSVDGYCSVWSNNGFRLWNTCKIVDIFLKENKIVLMVIKICLFIGLN